MLHHQLKNLCALIALSLLLSLGCMHSALGDDAQQEWSGSFDGQPVWARWLPPNSTATDPAQRQQRVLQLVYTPIAAERFDGTRLGDCPFLLLDAQARIIGWNSRSTQSTAEAVANGYRIFRERETGADRQLSSDQRVLTTVRCWDRQLLPIHLALVWTATSSGTATAVDLFATKPEPSLPITWSPGKLTIGTATWKIEADQRGRLRRLLDADGRERLRIDTRKP